MEAAPAAALVMPEPEFLLEVLVVALDPPAQHREVDERREGDLFRQRREPILRWLRLAVRPLDQQPFLRTRLRQGLIAMRRAHAPASKARAQHRVRARAPSDLGPRLSRQATCERLDR